MKQLEVRVAYALDTGSIPVLDPAKITSFHQSILLMNLYSGLIEYDLNGNLQSGIASKFYWDGLRLVFEFGHKVKTKSGHYIDAEDAAASIRRVLKLGSSTHTNLKYFLCNFQETDDVFKNCESIYVEDGKLIVQIQNEKHKPFVISTLAAGDLAVVPKSVIDRKSLAIIDNTETSGPYFLKSLGKEWELQQNPEHFQLSSGSPFIVKLIDVGSRRAGELLLENQVDILPTGINIPPVLYNKMRDEIPDFKSFETLPIKLYIVQFSFPGVRKTTVRQRFHIASQFRKILGTEYPLPIHSSPTYEFFLANGHGQLTQNQYQEILNNFNTDESEASDYKPSFYFYKNLSHAFSVFKKIEEIRPIETDRFPPNEPLDERLDLFIGTTDISFKEDLSLLGYNFNQGTFGYDEKQGEAWLAKYMAEESKEKRAEMARDLQFEGLKNGVIFPMFKAPYTVMARNGFSISMSPIFATTNFWRITKE